MVLDGECSYLITFHTPFGRYRWRRVPFGMSSVPEVFQPRMYQLIEGLSGIEVVAGDFMVNGCRNTGEEANNDHDRALNSVRERCEEQGVKLSNEKLNRRLTLVPFNGHITEDKVLRVDPAKVQVISEMPPPTDKAGVQRLLRLAQYLIKFCPHLSDITKPQRERCALDLGYGSRSGTGRVVPTPVSRYYNLEEEVTLQCGASQFRLGAALNVAEVGEVQSSSVVQKMVR